MTEDGHQRARRALHVLADLAPSAEQRSTGLTIPTEWFRWLSAESIRVFAPGPFVDDPPSPAASPGPRIANSTDLETTPFASVDRAFGERLAAIDQIRPEQRSLRVGWLFVAGSTETGEGRRQRVFLPLVSMPVRVDRPAFGSARLLPAGDVDITEMVDDRNERHRLEAQIQLGGGALDGVREVTVQPALLARLGELQRFALDAAASAGLPASEVVGAEEGPDELTRAGGLRVVAGVGVYASHETGTASRAGSLRAWATGPLAHWTAFHSLYVDLPPPDPGPVEGASDTKVESPFLLTPMQRRSVIQSRDQPITVISGAPGTGKSHTVAAIACDALARGQSVLVAARSDATVDALLDLFARAPGPEPVVFGSNERREALAIRLATGQLQPVADPDLQRARRAHAEARSTETDATDQIVEHLSAEELVAHADTGLSDARQLAPELFDASTDLAAVTELCQAASAPTTGWWSSWRNNRRLRELRRRAGSARDTGLPELERSLRAARAARVASGLVARGGLELGPAWEQLLRRQDDARQSTAQLLAAESRSGDRLNRSTLPAIAALATALRSGRAARREQLGRLDDGKLTRALSLWVGSLPDIDDLLPPTAGAFDLVILDEASSIDQPLAAPALLRGRRGVIVGDPHQLRHVSFLSDQRLRDTTEAHGLADHPLVAARLDVRRNSAFDVAAAVAPIMTLDEHFRSDPHLIDFVARHVYGGAVKVATRSPSTTSKDCIHLVRVDGRRDKKGVIGAEVEWTLGELARLRGAGVSSVGVITPFRAQADALEEAVLGRFSIDDLEALDLRVGTVHAFQGNERDVVIACLGVGPDQDGTSWRFVEDPHLFTVFVTRARKRMTVVASAEPPSAGTLAGYLAQADRPPGRPPPATQPSPWAAEIADDLRSGGLVAIPAYPTGRHLLDICVESSHDAAIECGVHVDGPEAHVDRHLALLRSGWTVLEAYPSKWSGRRGELIVELLHRLGPPAGASTVQ